MYTLLCYNISTDKKLVNKMKEFIAIMIILTIILLFLVFALMIIGILIEMIKKKVGEQHERIHNHRI